VPLLRANPLDQGSAPRRASIVSRKGAAITPLDAPLPLRLWHLASLDAPTVAVVWAFGFAWAARIRLPVWVPVLLALGAWAVYIGDRLLDARSGLRSGALHRLRSRHRFHWRYRRIFVPLAVASAASAAWIIVVLMPAGAREGDSALAAAALAYFTRVHSSRGLQPSGSPFLSPTLFPSSTKELLVGLLFTAGCAFPVFGCAVVTPNAPPWPLFVPAVFFALLAWLNCYAIERWESGEKQLCGFHAYRPAGVLALAGLLLAIFVSAAQPRSAALLAAGAASALLLALLDRVRSSLTPLALRAAADLVLLTPLALLLR
jgi:hypothetical protein